MVVAVEYCFVGTPDAFLKVLIILKADGVPYMGKKYFWENNKYYN